MVQMVVVCVWCGAGVGEMPSGMPLCQCPACTLHSPTRVYLPRQLPHQPPTTRQQELQQLQRTSSFPDDTATPPSGVTTTCVQHIGGAA